MAFCAEDKVRPFFSYLIDTKGFKIGKVSYDPRGYGEYVIVMTSDDFCVQLESDRGTNVSVLLSPPDQKEWHSLYYVQILITGIEAEPALSQSLKEEAQFIESNYQLIKTMYDADHRQETLQKLSGLIEAAGRKIAPGYYRELDEKRGKPHQP